MKRILAMLALITLMMTAVSVAGAETVRVASLAAVNSDVAKGVDSPKASRTIPRGKTVKAFMFWEGDRLYDLSNGSYFTNIAWKYYGKLKVTSSASWLKASENQLPYAKPNNSAAARTGTVIYRDNNGVVAKFRVTQTGRYNLTWFGQVTKPYKCIQMKWTGSRRVMNVNYAKFVITNNNFKTTYTKKIYDAEAIATARYTGYPVRAGKVILATVLPVKRMGSRYICEKYMTQFGAVYLDQSGVRIMGEIIKAGYNSCFAMMDGRALLFK